MKHTYNINNLLYPDVTIIIVTVKKYFGFYMTYSNLSRYQGSERGVSNL